MLSAAFSILLLLSTGIVPVTAVCCFPPFNVLLDEYICQDGTKPTSSSECCGYRSCNAFCCACGGGCRKGQWTKRQALPLPTGAPYDSSQCMLADEDRDCTRLVFAKIDTEQIGSFNVEQYLGWINESMHGGSMPDSVVQGWSDRFAKFDANGDGVLDESEVFRLSPLAREYEEYEGGY